MVWFGADGNQEQLLEELKKEPPPILKKRERRGSTRYNVKVTSGTKFFKENAGPLVQKEVRNRKLLTGRRRIDVTDRMLEDL